jgi:hypothetical protein
VTVTADAKTKVYGQADPPLTYQITSGSLAFSDTFSGALMRVAGETVAGSPYAILQGTLALNSNYVLTYIGANLTITKAATSVVVSSSMNPSIFNAPVTLTATVADSSPYSSGTPTGTVTFYAKYYGATSSVAIGSGTLNGSGIATLTTSSLPVNANLITATYGGDGNFTSNSGNMTQTVQYQSGGLCAGDLGHTILQPINADGSSVFNGKSTSPAKFRVCDANGISIGTAGVVSNFSIYQIVGGTVVNTVDEAVYSTTPDTAFRWDPTGLQWIFNINNKSYPSNQTYFFRINLNDGSSILFNYGLK